MLTHSQFCPRLTKCQEPAPKFPEQILGHGVWLSAGTLSGVHMSAAVIQLADHMYKFVSFDTSAVGCAGLCDESLGC
jgi:hypothetical protein